jgi:signal transduction histidine kinase
MMVNFKHAVLNFASRYLKQESINALTLRFVDNALEREFLGDNVGNIIRHARFALVVGIILYVAFGVLDAFIIPDAKRAAWIIRYGVVVPSVVVVYAFSYSRHFKRFMQPVLVVIVLVAGFGIIAMLMLADPPGTYLYYAGLILVTMYAYIFFRLRFGHAVVASWALVVAYELSAILIRPLPLSMLVNNTFFLISANLIGMFASYQTELSIRRDFLQRKLIRELEEKKYLTEKEKILKDLHDGVGGTTTNIVMLAEMAQVESSPSELHKMVSSIADLANDSLAEIRGFLHSLDVRELSWEACVAELRYRGSATLEPHAISLDIHSEIEGGSEKPGSLLTLNLFKIYRESLTNIVKHAKASAVDVHLRVDRSEIRLSIRDNGSGFAGNERQGRGLANMRARAAEIGGMLMVTGGEGTRIDLSIPTPVYPGAREREPSRSAG